MPVQKEHITLISAAERTRLLKLLDLLEAEDMPYELWWWDRGNSTPQANQLRELDRCRTISHWKGMGARRAVGYFLWMIRLLAACLRSRDRRYYCIGFDAALPVALLSSLGLVNSFVFDNADNISKSYSWPPLVKSWIVRMEEYIAGQADIHIVPGQSRWPSDDSNLCIIPNTPMASTYDRARQIAEEQGYATQPDGPLVLYVNGWLVDTRGIDTLVRALGEIQPSTQVVVAGPLGGAQCRQLVDHPRVEYLGRLDPEEALALYWKADLVLTYYDPALEINRVAEPNKWGDCIMTATPFIANEEVETAEVFVERQACFSLPYHDSSGLAKLLNRLSNDRKKLNAVKNNLGTFTVQPWDVSMTELLRDWMEHWK